MKKIILLTTGIIFVANLTACAEIGYSNSKEAEILVLSPFKKESKLPFHQYVKNMLDGIPIEQSIDLRFRKGKYGKLPFKISDTKKSLVNEIEYDCATIGTDVKPLVEVERSLAKIKGKLNKKPIMDCIEGGSGAIGSHLIYKLTINNKNLYLSEEVSMGGGCSGSTKLKIIKTLPSCETINKW